MLRLLASVSFVPLSALVSIAAMASVDVRVEGDRVLAEVDGLRVPVRESAARPVAGAAGSDPRGRAAFVTWTEEGQPWSAFSLDGGRSWKPARPLDDRLMLRAGEVRRGGAMPAVVAGLSLPHDGRLFVVQLRTISLPAWRSALEEAGAELLAFLPHDSYVVRVDPGLLPALRSLDFVERVEPYHPSYRLEQALIDWLEDPAAAPERLRANVVAFEWGESGKRRIAARAAEVGAEVNAAWPSGHIVELTVDRSQLREIAEHDDVMWIDRWSPPQTDMELVREDAGTNWLENNHGYCGQGVRGEVLDAGVQEDHPDFDGILLHGPHSVDSHGTSTYGIVFGNGDRDGDGDARGTGHMTCQEQGIFADFDSLGDRFARTQELKGSPYFAAFQSNSWGNARTFDYNSISAEMDDIIWRLDIAITQSQSNAGNQDSRPQAWAKNIISVGGIRHYNTLTTADDAWANGASIGPAADGRIKPDVCYWYDSIFTTTTGSGYTSSFGGTSAATPEVAGVLGLMMQMWADNVWGTDPEGTTVFEKLPHFTTIKALLLNNAQQYPFSGTSHDLTRVHQGWGRPNLQLAWERAARSFVIDEDVVLQLASPVAYDVDVAPGEAELKITMVYPDPPGTTSASLHRINDVNLKVTSPSGEVYHGNVGLDAANYSSPGGTPNSIDTVENVLVQDPLAGVWKVEIEAVEINQDAYLATAESDVTFALVVTGGTGAICPAPNADFTIVPDPARVGDTVTFDSTVGGGAGGPYRYRWDFDDDGIDDTLDVDDPVHVYRRPYAGNVKLRVRDADSCPESVTHVIDVRGPDLRFDGLIDMTEIEGNGNGGVDPGEVWEFRLRLRNDGNESAVGVSAALLAGPGNPGSVGIQQDFSAWADVPAGGAVASDAYFRISVGHDFPCGEDATFSLARITTTDPNNVYPEETGAVRILVGGSGPPVTFFFEGFETQNGWLPSGSDGEWQWEAPQGLGGQQSIPQQTPGPDPSSAFEGSRVLGNDLTGTGQYAGNYENDLITFVSSPWIDASDAVGVTMTLQRWLNVEQGDRAYLEVSNDGVQWTQVFDESNGVHEQAWSEQVYDISPIADRQPAVRIRVGLQSDFGLVQGGWNLDALALVGVTRQSCEPFAVGELGESFDLQVARGAAGELQLSWAPDCGAGTLYGVYRGDLGAGYGSIAPEPGQCAVSGNAVTIPQGAGNADFFLVVPNDGALEGSYGSDSTGAPRSAAAAGCRTQAGTLAVCVP